MRMLRHDIRIYRSEVLLFDAVNVISDMIKMLAIAASVALAP